jgi:hypothetical protein
MGDLSGEEWAALYRHYLHSQSPIDGNDCPASDEISSFFGRKTARRKKFLLLHHILDCESCRTQFEWWHELDLQVATLRKDVENLIGNSSSRGGDSKPAPQAKSALRRWAWAG